MQNLTQNVFLSSKKINATNYSLESLDSPCLSQSFTAIHNKTLHMFSHILIQWSGIITCTAYSILEILMYPT